MNPRTVSYIEGGLFTMIGFFTPIAETLISDRPLTTRVFSAAIVLGIIGGSNSAKAFLSQSSAQLREPKTAQVEVQVEPAKIEPASK